MKDIAVPIERIAQGFIEAARQIVDDPKDQVLKDYIEKHGKEKAVAMLLGFEVK